MSHNSSEMLAQREYDDSSLKSTLREILEAWKVENPNRVLIVGDDSFGAGLEFRSATSALSITDADGGPYDLVVSAYPLDFSKVTSKVAAGGVVISLASDGLKLEDEALKYFTPLELFSGCEVISSSVCTRSIDKKPSFNVLRRNNIPTSMVGGQNNGIETDKLPFISAVPQVIFSKEGLKISLIDGFYMAEESVKGWSCWFANKGKLFIETKREGIVRVSCTVSPFRKPAGTLKLSLGDDILFEREISRADRVNSYIAVIPGGNPIKILYDGDLYSPQEISDSNDSRKLGVLFSDFKAEYVA